MNLENVPKKVSDAAAILSNYFKENHIKNWRINNVCSLDMANSYYDRGLDTAISVVDDMNIEGKEVLLCALENSKIS